jgi:hypothetical protein
MSKFSSFRIDRTVALGSLALLASLLVLITMYKADVQKDRYYRIDIFFIWSAGHEIAHGENPYSKIHGSNMLENHKYSTFLPGFYLIVSGYVALGHETFGEWMSFWRPANFAIHYAIGVFLFFVLLPRGGFWLALFGSQFWLLSRWTIQIVNAGQIDALPIAILLVSMWILPRYKRTSLILFGASLSIKQIGIFMLPVYLLLESDLDKPLMWNFGQGVKNLLYIAALPLLICLPFLIWDARGLFLSILFSATRSPSGIKVPSIDALLGYVGLVAKIPMILMMACVYFLVLQRRIGRFMAALALFLTFPSFNSVLFSQYMAWFCAFLGLAAAEAPPTAALAFKEHSESPGEN